MQAQTQSIAQGIEKAFPDERLPHLELGRYRVKIQRVKQGVSSQFSKVPNTPYFKAEVTVVASEGEGANAPGTSASVFIMKDRFGYYLKDIRSFVAATLNEPIDSVTQSTVDEITAEDNPAQGNELTIEVIRVDKENGKSFNKLRFQAIQ